MAYDGEIRINSKLDSKGIEKGLKGLGGIVANGMGAATAVTAAAMGKLGKEVVSAFADYEQLVGGVDTLFKESSSALQEYAANAYQTAGLSANEYMETVTSFSASLISSLGGDTEKAVQYADMAITDMSDNANKMGSDMESIQNAYQGFAKQNYTMLDNLKLGYGGTKTEMERLLKDAEAISGIHYDVSSYADVVSAIHVIQESMGIAGTTALEAEQTISGSINATKAALSNLIVGFGRADADMKTLTQNMMDSFKNVMTNITPVIENIIQALPTAIDGMTSALVSLFPTIIDTITGLFSQGLETILSLLPQLIPIVVQALITIVDALIANIPLVMDAAITLIESLVTGLTMALPQLIPAAVQALMTIVNGLIANIPMLLDAALQLLTGLAQGIIDAIPVLIDAIPAVVISLVDTLLESLPVIIQAGIDLLTALVDALPEIIDAIVAVIPEIIDGIVSALLESLPVIVQAGIDLLVALIQALPEIISTIVAAIPQIVSAISDAIIGNIGQIVDVGVQLFIALIENLPTIIAEIVKAIPQIVAGIVNAFTQLFPKLVEVGGNLIKGVWQGISDAGAWLWGKISGFFSGIVDKIKGFFGINSPSKLFRDEIGAMIPAGMALGIKGKSSESTKAAEEMAKDVYEAASEWIDEYQRSEDYMLKEEIKMWAELEKMYIKGSEQRKRIEKELYSAREKLYKDSISLINQMQKAEDDYQNSLDNRTKALKNTYGLFDKVEQKDKVSGQTLIKNLKSQVDALEDWESEMSELEGYGVLDKALTQELREMGPEAIAQIRALTSMTGDELQEYNELWKKQSALAKESAIKELEPLREETNEIIKGLYSDLLDLADDETMVKLAKDTVGAALEQFKIVYEGVGEDMATGLANGILSKISVVTDAARGMADAAYQAVVRALEIHSPSKKFMVVGEYSADGMAEGFVGQLSKVYKRIEDAIAQSQGSLLEPAYAAASRYQSSMAQRGDFNRLAGSVVHNSGTTYIDNSRNEFTSPKALSESEQTRQLENMKTRVKWRL